MPPTARKKTAPERIVVGGYAWNDLHRLVGTTLRAGISVLLRGHPGVGKSTLAAALAEEMGLPLVDIRLSQRDPVDLCGVWFPDRDRRVLESYPPAWAQEAAARPCFLFLDEINAAVTKLHQAAAYQIVLEKRVGDVRFHPGTVVMAAGNLEEDNAIVTQLSSALCNRFAHFTMKVDAPTWLAWAERSGVPATVRAYVAEKGVEVLYEQGADATAFPSPRSWEMASRLLLASEPADAKRLVAACIGPSHAEQFFAWIKLSGMVDPVRVVEQGILPEFRGLEASVVHATVMAVAMHLRGIKRQSALVAENATRFLAADGLDREHAFLAIRGFADNRALLQALRAIPAFRSLAADLVTLQLDEAS
jgi:MoxR-like ATPase